MAEKDYQLVVQEGPKPGQVFDLVNSSMILGRDELADIIIVDPEVSRQHVQFTETETGYRLQDLGSTNGTFVNGRSIAAEGVDLEPGQEIRLGSTIVLLYQLVDDDYVLPTFPLDEDESDEPEADDDLFIFARPDKVETEDEDEVEAESWLLADLEEEVEEVEETAVVELDPPTPFTETAVTSSDLAPTPQEQPVPTNGNNGLQRNGPLVPTNHNPTKRRRNRNRTVLLSIILLILCCVAFTLFMWFVAGDPLLQQLGLI